MAALTRHTTLVAALLLAGSVVPVLAGVLTERWVLETRGESRVVLGPRRMEICNEGACRVVVYSRSIAELRIRRSRAVGVVERERLEAALERMQYNGKKGLQILVPGVVIAGLWAAFAVLLLWRRRAGVSAWAGSSIRFWTGGLVIGLAAAALVFADGLSHLPAAGTRTQWGFSFFLVLGGDALALLGGILAGMGPKEEHAAGDAPS